MKNIKKYQLFVDAEVSIEELSDVGDIYTIGEFVQNIISGTFIDYDGYARFVIRIANKNYEITDITYSIASDSVYFKDEELCGIVDFARQCKLFKIVWYNK